MENRTEMIAAARTLLSLRNGTVLQQKRPSSSSSCCDKRSKHQDSSPRPRRSCANYEAGAFTDMDDSVDELE